MLHETLPTIDQLNRMDDLTGATLYRAEVRQIPFLTGDEQGTVIAAARAGDREAQHRLVCNCLNWTMRRAGVIYRNQEPLHSDVMDLIGHANVSMLEAIPFALRADDPISYMMTVSAAAMRRYCAYKDPLIERSRDRSLREPHQMTVSIDGNAPYTRTVPAPELTVAETSETPEQQLIACAVQSLSQQYQRVLIAAHGLFGHPTMKNQDIADMMGLPKETVEKYLWRARRRLAAKLVPYLTELRVQAV